MNMAKIVVVVGLLVCTYLQTSATADCAITAPKELVQSADAIFVGKIVELKTSSVVYEIIARFDGQPIKRNIESLKIDPWADYSRNPEYAVGQVSLRFLEKMIGQTEIYRPLDDCGEDEWFAFDLTTVSKSPTIRTPFIDSITKNGKPIYLDATISDLNNGIKWVRACLKPGRQNFYQEAICSNSDIARYTKQSKVFKYIWSGRTR